MKNEKETKENLLKSAKQEFLEKGYMQASLRNICKNAGVTTGALYFFFQDKEDLFSNLVKEPLDELYQIMSSHYKEEMELEIEPETLTRPESFEDDIRTVKQIVHLMYQHYDAFQLLLVKSQGSRFENCAEQFAGISERHYRVLADRISEGMGAERVEDYMIHWVAHMQIDAFVHMITQERNEEDALRHMESVGRYIITGWFSMFHKK